MGEGARRGDGGFYQISDYATITEIGDTHEQTSTQFDAHFCRIT